MTLLASALPVFWYVMYQLTPRRTVDPLVAVTVVLTVSTFPEIAVMRTSGLLVPFMIWIQSPTANNADEVTNNDVEALATADSVVAGKGTLAAPVFCKVMTGAAVPLLEAEALRAVELDASTWARLVIVVLPGDNEVTLALKATVAEAPAAKVPTL